MLKLIKHHGNRYACVYDFRGQKCHVYDANTFQEHTSSDAAHILSLDLYQNGSVYSQKYGITSNSVLDFLEARYVLYSARSKYGIKMSNGGFKNYCLSIGDDKPIHFYINCNVTNMGYWKWVIANAEGEFSLDGDDLFSLIEECIKLKFTTKSECVFETMKEILAPQGWTASEGGHMLRLGQKTLSYDKDKNRIVYTFRINSNTQVLFYGLPKYAKDLRDSVIAALKCIDNNISNILIMG